MGCRTTDFDKMITLKKGLVIKMNRELLDVLHLLEQEKGIPYTYMVEKIKEGIKKAVENDYRDAEVVVDINDVTGEMTVCLRKDVVDEVYDPVVEVLYEDALRYSTSAVLGGKVDVPIDVKELRRISALNAKNIIRQGIRDAERDYLYNQLKKYKDEIVTTTVTRVDPENDDATIEIGNIEVTLPKREQLPTETLKELDRIRVYVVNVFGPGAPDNRPKSERPKSSRQPKVMISRTHPGLVKRLFEMEVPEIYDGTVEIRGISREAGYRTKLAVYSKDPDVDPVGACIGMDGGRVKNIVKELGGEKIEVVRFSEDPAEFIKAALSPATVVSVTLDPEGAKSCQVVVPDNQLSLAIGNKGQSAKLAAKLTGWKIDIKPESSMDAVASASAVTSESAVAPVNAVSSDEAEK